MQHTLTSWFNILPLECGSIAHVKLNLCEMKGGVNLWSSEIQTFCKYTGKTSNYMHYVEISNMRKFT